MLLDRDVAVARREEKDLEVIETLYWILCVELRKRALTFTTGRNRIVVALQQVRGKSK